MGDFIRRYFDRLFNMGRYGDMANYEGSEVGFPVKFHNVMIEVSSAGGSSSVHGRRIKIQPKSGTTNTNQFPAMSIGKKKFGKIVAGKESEIDSAVLKLVKDFAERNRDVLIFSTDSIITSSMLKDIVRAAAPNGCGDDILYGNRVYKDRLLKWWDDTDSDTVRENFLNDLCRLPDDWRKDLK
jgi:hypothetical protein